MTANPTADDQPFTIVLDDDESNPAEGRLRKIDAGPTWAKHRVRVELAEADTSGHALDATTVSINLSFDDDVEGHALSLHFPTAAKADEFRKRLLATGIVAGALVVGVTAAQLSSTVPSTSINPIVQPAPIAAPAPHFVQPLVKPGIPAEDLAPAVPAEPPAERIRVQTSAVAPAAESPAERIRVQTSSVAPAAESPAERARDQRVTSSAAPAAESPAERARDQRVTSSAAPAAESPAERARDQRVTSSAAPAAESPAERARDQRVTQPAESPAESIRDEAAAASSATEPPAERNRH
jgi:hypothetical protein